MQVRLLTLLVQLDELAEEHICNVYSLLLDSSREVRQAAAELVAGTLEQQGRQRLDEQQVAGCYGRRTCSAGQFS